MKSLEEAYMEKKNESNLFVNKLLKEYFEDFCSAKQLMENPKKIIQLTNGVGSLMQLEESNREDLSEFTNLMERNLTFLTNKNQNEVNEAFNSCAVFAKGIKNWDLSSDLFLEFSEQPAFSLLQEETVDILWKMSDQINSLTENKKKKLQKECVTLNFVVSDQLIKEAKEIFENELHDKISFLNEQDYQGKQKQIVDVIGKIEKVLNALNQNISDVVPDNAELPKIKNGLLKFAADFRQAAASGRAGASKGFKSIDLMIVQAQMVLSMFESLSKNWGYIQTVLRPEIQKIESLGASATDQSFDKFKSILSTMIIRTISKSGKGKWGERIAAIARTIKGKINYPLSITPAIIATDIIDLLARANEAQTKQTSVQQQTPPTQASQTPTATAPPTTLTENKGMVFEDLQSVMKAIQKLGDVFKKAEPSPVVLPSIPQAPQAPTGQPAENQAQASATPQASTATAPGASPAPVPSSNAVNAGLSASSEEIANITDEEAKEELGLAKGLTTLNKIKGAVASDPELKAKLKKFFAF